jgi:hypothetical protein
MSDGADDGGEETCGQDIAGDAEVPELLARLLAHVAGNMEAHAAWVGRGSDAARLEHDGLAAVSRAWRDMAAAAARAAEAMRAMRDLPAAPHDPAGLDRAAFGRWMREKVAMQRALARMLLEHAEVSERVLGGDG